MKPDLLTSITSPQELKAITLEVRRYAKWFSQASVKTKVAGDSPREPLMISEAAAELIKGLETQKPLDSTSLDQLIAALQALETDSKRITFTLAAVAPNSVKKSLVGWCREHIDPNILVDFRFDATLLGGMVVRYGSHVYDWSFRRQILAARGRFPEVLRNV